MKQIRRTEVPVDGFGPAVALMLVLTDASLIGAGELLLQLLAAGSILLSGWVALYLTVTSEAHSLQMIKLSAPDARKQQPMLRILKAA